MDPQSRQVGLGRKAELIDAGEQVFLPQLLGFSLDQLGLSPHPQDVVFELFHPLFVLRHARLDIGIPACTKVNWRKKAPTDGGGDGERKI